VAVGNIDRLVFAGLYRLVPEVLDALKILKPETVIRWHRAGFRAWWRWKSRSRRGRPRTAAELRQLIREMSIANPAMGSPADPRRIAQARHRSRPDHGGKIHGEETTAAVARLEGLSSQSCRCHCVDGHVRGADDLVSAVVWTSHLAACAPRASMAGRDPASECRMDCPSTDRGLWLERTATLHYSRSRRRLWRCIHPARCSHGHTGSTDLGSVAMAKRMRGTAHRFNPAGVS
jgi:hypothetical protein